MSDTTLSNAVPSTVLTHIIGSGPLMVLDINAVQATALMPLIQAALRVADEWENLNISVEHEEIEKVLDTLSEASNSLNEMFAPIIPGTPYSSRGHLMGTDTYPIIRNGQVEQVKAEDLNPLELMAVHRWLQFHAFTADHHSKMIQARLQGQVSKSA